MPSFFITHSIWLGTSSFFLFPFRNLFRSPRHFLIVYVVYCVCVLLAKMRRVYHLNSNFSLLFSYFHSSVIWLLFYARRVIGAFSSCSSCAAEHFFRSHMCGTRRRSKVDIHHRIFVNFAEKKNVLNFVIGKISWFAIFSHLFVGCRFFFLLCRSCSFFFVQFFALFFLLFSSQFSYALLAISFFYGSMGISRLFASDCFYHFLTPFSLAIRTMYYALHTLFLI